MKQTRWWAGVCAVLVLALGQQAGRADEPADPPAGETAVLEIAEIHEDGDHGPGPPAPADSLVIPTDLQDAAFEHYVSLAFLGTAWECLDPSGIADAALQFAEGERVLHRSHKAIKSADLFQLAIKMAVDRRDTSTLDRLLKYAQKAGDTAMVQAIVTAQKLAGATRAADPTMQVAVAEVSAADYVRYRGVIGEVKAASYVGDRETLARLADQVKQYAGFSASQKQHLLSLISGTREGIKSNEPPALANHLDRLMDVSRGWKAPKISTPRIPTKPGPFQQKVIKNTQTGYEVGKAVAGPKGAVVGAAVGAVGTVAENHNKKRWSNGGWKNWKDPRRW